MARPNRGSRLLYIRSADRDGAGRRYAGGGDERHRVRRGHR